MDLRRRLASKARYRDSRINSFSRTMPTDWGPEKIINPETTFPFSTDSAWNLIADLLENPEIKIEIVVLEKPPGKEAIVLLYDFDPEQSFLYIKVHIGARDKVIGRSFHLSTKGRS